MTLAAGGKVDAGDFVAGISPGIPKVIWKTVSESVTSSTTMQDDDALTFTMLPGVLYEVDLYLSVSGNTAGDFKSQWSVPADATGGLKQCIGPAAASSAGWVSRNDTNGRFTSHGFTTPVDYHIESNGSFIWERGFISSATGGTFRLQWAQQVSNATATVISGNSFLKYSVVAL